MFMHMSSNVTQCGAKATSSSPSSWEQKASSDEGVQSDMLRKNTHSAVNKKNVKSINLFTGFHLPFNLSQAELNVSLKGRLITQQEKQ